MSASIGGGGDSRDSTWMRAYRREFNSVKLSVRASGLGSIFLLDDSAYAEPAGELGFDLAPGDVAMSEQNERMEQQIGDLVDQVRSALGSRFVGGLGDLASLFGNFAANLCISGG